MLGIIGGTGFYKLAGLEIIEERDVTTPYGKPSAPLCRARFADKDIMALLQFSWVKFEGIITEKVNWR